MANSSSQRRLETLLGHLKAGKEISVQPQPTLGAPAASRPAKYRYSTDTGLLTPEQRDFYEKNGYLVVRGLVSQDKLDTYRERFRQICEREVKVRLLLLLLPSWIINRVWVC